jgi:cytochrome c5
MDIKYRYKWFITDRTREFSMKKLAMVLLLTVILSACSTTSPATQPAEKPQQPAVATAVQPTIPPAAPVIDGAALLEDRCSVCHSANKAKQAPRAKSDWEKTVSRMIVKGAQLNDAEKQALIDYLAQTYGK